MVKEERCDMVVEDVEQHIGLLFLQPGLDRLEALENRRPGCLVLFIVIDCEADGWGVRDRKTTNNTCHVSFL